MDTREVTQHNCFGALVGFDGAPEPPLRHRQGKIVRWSLLLLRSSRPRPASWGHWDMRSWPTLTKGAPPSRCADPNSPRHGRSQVSPSPKNAHLLRGAAQRTVECCIMKSPTTRNLNFINCLVAPTHRRWRSENYDDRHLKFSVCSALALPSFCGKSSLVSRAVQASVMKHRRPLNSSSEE